MFRSGWFIFYGQGEQLEFILLIMLKLHEPYLQTRTSFELGAALNWEQL
jgi:hypothetical protein